MQGRLDVLKYRNGHNSSTTNLGLQTWYHNPPVDSEPYAISMNKFQGLKTEVWCSWQRSTAPSQYKRRGDHEQNIGVHFKSQLTVRWKELKFRVPSHSSQMRVVPLLLIQSLVPGFMWVDFITETQCYDRPRHWAMCRVQYTGFPDIYKSDSCSKP